MASIEEIRELIESSTNIVKAQISSVREDLSLKIDNIAERLYTEVTGLRNTCSGLQIRVSWKTSCFFKKDVKKLLLEIYQFFLMKMSTVYSTKYRR